MKEEEEEEEEEEEQHQILSLVLDTMAEGHCIIPLLVLYSRYRHQRLHS